MSGARTTVDGTEAEEWETERNRVAWNLPRESRRAPSQPTHEAANETGTLPEATDKAAEDG